MVFTMTNEELTIIDFLADAYNKFVKLPIQHPMDQDEFCRGIHILQRHIMARETRRNHPEFFINNTDERERRADGQLN